MSSVLSLAAFLLVSPTPRASPTLGAIPLPRSACAALDRGRVTWFEGTFEQASAEAARTKQLIFLDFWASWCGWCKRFDRDALNDTAVVTEMKDLICLAVDYESKEGQPLAARYGVSDLPGLVFLDPDGSLRDRVVGFRTPEQFVIDVRRAKSGKGTLGEIEKRIASNPKDAAARLDLAIRLRQLHDPNWNRELAAARELVGRNEGFDATSPDERFAIALRLRTCEDREGYAAQIAAIRKLDPEGKSVPMRRLALDERVQGIHTKFQREHVFDPSAVKAFIADEKSAEVRFEGWSKLRSMASYQAQEQDRRGQQPIAAVYRGEAREYGRQAWKDCPADRVAEFGRELALSFLAQAAELGDEDRQLAAEVAAKAAEAVSGSREGLKTLADCLELAGRNEEARAVRRKIPER